MQLTAVTVFLCLASVVPTLLLVTKLCSVIAGRIASYMVR